MEDEEAFCYSGKNTSLYRQDAGFLLSLIHILPMASGSCCRLGRGSGKEVIQDPLHARLSRFVPPEEGLQIFKEIDGPPIVLSLIHI